MNSLIEKYAYLCVTVGVNLQPGQELVIDSPVECSEFARVLTKTAYDCGASNVEVNYYDENIQRLNFQKASIEKLTNIPEFKKDRKLYYAKNKFCSIKIYAENPENLKGIDSERLSQINIANAKAFKEYMELSMKNYFAWLVISAPTPGWAKAVFPDEKDEHKAIEKLWEAIFKATRITESDPIQAWKTHQEKVKQHLNFLNTNSFKSLHFQNSLGTDLTVGMADDHVWEGVGDKTMAGKEFIPNIPTEEVYSLPHKNRIDGTVFSSLPLNFNGTVIDKFNITYKNGKVVNFKAEKGQEMLEEIFKIDEGTLSLGEVALVPYDSPISNLNMLFYNTLFDENAACHLAIGRGYPSTIKNGSEMSKEQLEEKGLNDSLEHIDFMFGTKDMKVTGINKNNEEIVIFEDGNWAY